MILSNTEIVDGLKNDNFNIGPLDNLNPSQAPFNTSAVDLRLADEITIPKADSSMQIDITKPGIANLLHKNSIKKTIAEDQPYSLKKSRFILAKTLETVDFPVKEGEICYSARVEGKSSLARCGILIHFTAPTIHAGFQGTIALEIINLGEFDFLLTPKMYICQLIIEEVRGTPASAPNQFKGQTSPTGLTN